MERKEEVMARRSEPEPHLQLSEVPDGRTLGCTAPFIAPRSSPQTDGRTEAESFIVEAPHKGSLCCCRCSHI